MTRSSSIDQAKGLAILGVIYIHAEFLVSPQGPLQTLTLNFARMAVPCFIGWFCYFLELQRREPASASRGWWPRAGRLLWPFVFWSTIYMVVSAEPAQLADQPLGILTKHWLGYGWSGQYFFLILFQLLAIFPLLRWLARSRARVAAVFFGTAAAYWMMTYMPDVVPGPVALLGHRFAGWWLPYALLGIVAARPPQNEGSGGTDIPVWSVIAAVALIPAETLIQLGIGIKSAPEYWQPSILFGSSAILIASIQGKTSLGNVAGTALAHLGRQSMALFVLNPLIILMAALLIDAPLGLINSTASYLVSVATAVFVALVATQMKVALQWAGLSRVV